MPPLPARIQRSSQVERRTAPHTEQVNPSFAEIDALQRHRERVKHAAINGPPSYDSVAADHDSHGVGLSSSPDPIPGNLRVSLVIPTLNEAPNLPHVFHRLPAGFHEIIVIDGGSTDGTVELARRLRPDVRILQQSGKGKGNALATGFAACTGDVIVMLDADGSTDPGEASRYVQAILDGAEFAKGSRFLAGGGSSDITQLRRLGNSFLCAIVNVLYGTKYSDLCYGYNAFLSSCLVSLDVDCQGFEVETLINIRVAKLGMKVAEVPSFEADRIHGVSKLHPIRDGLRVLRTVFRERLISSSIPKVAFLPGREVESDREVRADAS